MEKITFTYEFKDTEAQRTYQAVLSPEDSITWQAALDEFIDFLGSAGYVAPLVDIAQHLNKRIYMETAAPSYYGVADNAVLPD